MSQPTTPSEPKRILLLPTELQQNILNYVNNNNAANFGLACKQFQTITIDNFINELFNVFKTANTSGASWMNRDSGDENSVFMSFGHISFNEYGDQPYFFGLRCRKNETNTFTWYKLTTENLNPKEYPRPLNRLDLGCKITEDKINEWVEFQNLNDDMYTYIQTIQNVRLVGVYVDTNMHEFDEQKVRNLLSYIKCLKTPTAGGNSPKTSVTYNSKIYKLYGKGKEKYIRVQRQKVFLADIRGKYRYR